MSVLKSRKARAVLAGGVVLGIGASMTLAAWSDSEWATGTFGTGGFTFQGSTNGTDFTDNATQGDAAELTFTLDADNLTPGDSVEATFWVKATGADANVAVAAPAIETTNALSSALTVEYFNNDDCSDAPTSSGALTSTTIPSRVATDGTALATCIRVTLPSGYSNTDDLTTGAVAWEFAATTD